jgi:hypothetical protein
MDLQGPQMILIPCSIEIEAELGVKSTDSFSFVGTISIWTKVRVANN